MDTPIMMLVDVVFWSFGVSAAILAGLIWLDRIAARGEDVSSLPQLRFDTPATVTRLPQTGAARRSANEATAAKAA